MGEVYRTTHTGLGRDVALKVLPRLELEDVLAGTADEPVRPDVDRDAAAAERQQRRRHEGIGCVPV